MVEKYMQSEAQKQKANYYNLAYVIEFENVLENLATAIHTREISYFFANLGLVTFGCFSNQGTSRYQNLFANFSSQVKLNFRDFSSPSATPTFPTRQHSD